LPQEASKSSSARAHSVSTPTENARAATVPAGCQKPGFADILEGLLVLGSPRTRGATWKRLGDGRPVLAAGEPAAAFRFGRDVVELVVVVEG
jgi:hypothetical protein